MKVHFFDRKRNNSSISIEKLFAVIKVNIAKKIEIRSFSNPFFLTLIGIIKAMFFFRNNQSDINHITGDIHWAAFFLKKRKTILTIHDIVGMESLSGIKRIIYFLIWFYVPAKRVKYIVAISEKTKLDLIKILPWAKNKIIVIPNCYTMEPDFSEIEPISKIPIFLIVGTRSNKNIENIISALQNIKCTLYVVGEMSQNYINKVNFNNINLINVIEISDQKLIELYKIADILLFVSTFEGFGLPIIEAQSQDCIVVTSNLEPMLEVAGEGAIFVNPFEIGSITTGIVQILNDFELQQILIQKARKNIERFNPKEVAKDYIKVYEQLNLENRKIFTKL